MSLFGNLFGEDGGDDSDNDENFGHMSSCVGDRMVGTSSGIKRADENTGLTDGATTMQLVKPPAPRPEHGFCGLTNQGATCYLNSLLQVICAAFGQKLSTCPRIIVL